MNKVIAIITVIAFIVAIPVSNNLMAGKEAKVKVCHITAEGEWRGANGYIGHVIEVSENAVKAHCSHGDHAPNPNKVIGDECGRWLTQVVDCDNEFVVK